MNTLGSCVFIKTFRKHLLRIQCSGIGLEKSITSNIPILFQVWGVMWSWHGLNGGGQVRDDGAVGDGRTTCSHLDPMDGTSCFCM